MLGLSLVTYRGGQINNNVELLTDTHGYQIQVARQAIGK